MHWIRHPLLGLWSLIFGPFRREGGILVRRWPPQLPIHKAFVDATTFAKSTDLHLTPIPSIHLASDGEINFLWKDNGIHIDLGFYGNGKYSYYAEAPCQEPMYGDDLDVSAGMPQQLLDLFRSSVA